MDMFPGISSPITRLIPDDPSAVGQNGLWRTHVRHYTVSLGLPHGDRPYRPIYPCPWLSDVEAMTTGRSTDTLLALPTR